MSSDLLYRKSNYNLHMSNQYVLLLHKIIKQIRNETFSKISFNTMIYATLYLTDRIFFCIILHHMYCSLQFYYDYKIFIKSEILYCSKICLWLILMYINFQIFQSHRACKKKPNDFTHHLTHCTKCNILLVYSFNKH